MYSLEELASARLDLTAAMDKFDRYSGNNPDKYRGEIESAKMRIHAKEEALKISGALPRTATEIRDAELDKVFPDARSKQVVEWQGKRYIRRFTPVSKSLSGKTVKAWNKFWQEAPE